MPRWPTFRSWLRALVFRSRLERDLDDELRFHIQEESEAAVRAGMTSDEARGAAIASLGDAPLRVKETCRERRGMSLVDDLERDVRYAVRQLTRSPGFAVASILCLALGIAATTTVYSVVDTILLQPLPYPHSDRLVRVIEHVPPSIPGRPIMRLGIPYREFVDWGERASTLNDSFAVREGGRWVARTRQGLVGLLWGTAATPNAFTVLGVTAMLGRTLDAGDTVNADVTVLSFDTWQRHFNADPNIVGTTVEMGAGALTGSQAARLLTVVGVLPPQFEFPIGPSDFYTALRAPSPASQSMPVTMIGRLAPGVSLEAASDELNAMGAAVRPPWPADAPALTASRFELERLKDVAVNDLRQALAVFLAAVVVVLLIVCANVANLLLARGTARQREMALRLAIGASRGGIVRQIMTECLVLAMAGGALGALGAAGGVMLVKRLAAVDAPGIFRLMFASTILPRAHELRVDSDMLGIALGIAVITSVVFGLLPALQLSRPSRFWAAGSSASGPARSRTRAVLVGGQLALATILLVCAGLLTQSVVNLTGNNKGYDERNVVALQLLLPNQYTTVRKAETIDALLTHLRRLPGVRAAGFSRHDVLIGEALGIGTLVPPGRKLDELRNDPARPQVRSVSDGFLTAMGTPLLDGRDFEPRDGASAAPVIVVNRSAARQWFGSNRAVGQLVDWHLGERVVQAMVVGVVADIRQESLAQDTFPEVYVEYRQLLSLLDGLPQSAQRQNEWAIGFLSFAIRTFDAPASIVPAVRQAVLAVDPNAGIDALVPMSRLVSSAVAREHFSATLLGAFAIVAGVLAAIGIYGLLAYLVVQRTTEIGIRMALGARRAQVLGLVLRRGMFLAGIGIAFGLLGAAAATRVLEGMLYGISPLEPRTFAAVAVLFGAVTAIASYLPAREATRVDPMVALRHE